MSAPTEYQPQLPTLTDADLSDFLAWQGSDAEALAPVVSLDVEPASEEDRYGRGSTPLAWQGSDAEALAPVVSLDVEPASEEDRDETPATDYPEDYGYEGPEFNPYVDDYDRWQDDLAADRAERTFRN